MSYVDKYSWRGFLGPQSKDITFRDMYAYWRTPKATNVVFFDGFSDFSLVDELLPFTTYYVNSSLFNKLKERYEFSHRRTRSTIIGIDSLKITGRKMRNFRWAINNVSKMNLTIEEDYRSIDDIREMIKKWKLFAGEKYFQDRSSKNIYFYGHRYHEGCINLFCYDKDKLVSFGILSPPNKGYSSYILGKSLYNEYKGLSEYTDIMLFRKGIENGVINVDMGDGGKDLMFYKNKFSSSREEIFYHGKILKRQEAR